MDEPVLSAPAIAAIVAQYEAAATDDAAAAYLGWNVLPEVVSSHERLRQALVASQEAMTHALMFLNLHDVQSAQERLGQGMQAAHAALDPVDA